MMQYCNGYACAVNQSLGDIVVNLTQKCPIIDENGKVTGSQTDTLSSVVMHIDTAKALAEDILALVEALDLTDEDAGHLPEADDL